MIQKLAFHFWWLRGPFFTFWSTFVTQIVHPKHQKLNVIQKPTFHFLKIFYSILQGGYIFLRFLTFFNRFTLKPLKMTHNGECCLNSGLDWLKTANIGYLAGFPIFSSKMRLRLMRNCQYHTLHNFSHLLPPKPLIFGEISKIFILGGTLAIFLSFSTFLNHFTL